MAGFLSGRWRRLHITGGEAGNPSDGALLSDL